MTVEIAPRTFGWRLYFRLRRIGLPWWDCLRVMWHGADLSIEEGA